MFPGTHFLFDFQKKYPITANMDISSKSLSDHNIVDQLSEKVKKAAFLIKICKSKLATTEEDVNEILKELENATKDPGKFR